MPPIFLFQDLIDIGDIVEESNNAIQTLGGFSPTMQSAALVSLAVGVVLLVIVWAWSRTKDENAFRRSLREQAEYTQKQRRDTDIELEKERTLRRQKEDKLSQTLRLLEDCNGTIIKFQAVNGNQVIDTKDIQLATIEEPKANNVEDAINLPTLSVSELLKNIPSVEAQTKPATRSQARKSGQSNNFFE